VTDGRTEGQTVCVFGLFQTFTEDFSVKFVDLIFLFSRAPVTVFVNCAFLEAIVGGWILDAIKLTTRQFEALKDRSTTHAVIDMLHHGHAAVDSRSSVRVLFVNFAKSIRQHRHRQT